jgi:hypothetical protein
MNNYIINKHAIKKALIDDYGSDIAENLKLVRNPFNKQLLEVKTLNGTTLETYFQIPKLGWIKQ